MHSLERGDDGGSVQDGRGKSDHEFRGHAHHDPRDRGGHGDRGGHDGCADHRLSGLSECSWVSRRHWKFPG